MITVAITIGTRLSFRKLLGLLPLRITGTANYHSYINLSHSHPSAAYLNQIPGQLPLFLTASSAIHCEPGALTMLLQEIDTV